ncbi:hypothetical protein F511_46707 [Dorcoceras hygrometricum]|uniref:Uncharacterized protein n=1 Tax=Dorcoceras hygrometricum TaxID=472368 RepID=A0A2Z6ZZQ2_9LAMI|nr:hypothetical protein F511_46707 [Dorcoceras hygrometricum]
MHRLPRAMMRRSLARDVHRGSAYGCACKGRTSRTGCATRCVNGRWPAGHGAICCAMIGARWSMERRPCRGRVRGLAPRAKFMVAAAGRPSPGDAPAMS